MAPGRYRRWGTVSLPGRRAGPTCLTTPPLRARRRQCRATHRLRPAAVPASVLPSGPGSSCGAMAEKGRGAVELEPAKEGCSELDSGFGELLKEDEVGKDPSYVLYR